MASFGENLRRERELRGIDLHEMAEATKISIRFLQALEQDRVEVLPGGIFPRAFVRQYGKFLGLDPERLVAEFVFAYGGEPVPTRAPTSKVHVDRPQKGWMIGAAALAVAGGLAWMMWSGPEPAPVAAAPQASAPPVTFPLDRVYPPPGGPAAAAPAARGLVLDLRARSSSWVEARVDGVTVLNRVLEQGESQRLEARDGVTLSVGNAGGVEYSVNGGPSTLLGKDGEVRRNVSIAASGTVTEPPVPAPIRARPRRASPTPAAAPAEAPASSPEPGGP